MADQGPRFTPEWAWWLLFGLNALFALYWATEGEIPLLAVLGAFVAGMAMNMATFGRRVRRIEQLDAEFSRHLRALGIDVEDQG